jgi:hypothetical protein
MHDLFSDWLEDAGLDVRNYPLALWSDGLEEYCSNIGRQSLLGLLRFACISEGPEKLVPTGLREALKGKDPALRMQGNTFLMAELARIAIRILFDGTETNHNLGHAAALGLIVGSFGQTLSAVRADHLEAANRYIVARANEIRIRPKNQFGKEAPQADLLNAIQDAADLEQLKTQAKGIAARLSKNSINLNAIFSRLLIQDEELDILWWLFSETSRDLNKPFRDLNFGAAALVAASELADLISFPPGPVSTEGLLRRALGRNNDPQVSEQTKVADAVNALEKNWKLKAEAILAILGEATCLCPLHLIIMKSYEAASPKDWPALIRAVSCDVDPDLELAPVSLAVQMFQERMFSASIQLI